MKVTAWRIFKPKHTATAFTGEGARLYGGRWNSKGIPVVYTAGSCSLAALEMLVHLQNPQILEAYLVAEISLDSRVVPVEIIETAALPSDWRADPAPSQLKALGDQWIAAAASAVLRVPSAIIDTEFNYLINPSHVGFFKITVGGGRPFQFDPRLAK